MRLQPKFYLKIEQVQTESIEMARNWQIHARFINTRSIILHSFYKHTYKSSTTLVL